MSTIFDYMTWRGDLEFWQDGFNDVDNLVLCGISYAQLEDVFAGSEEAVIKLGDLAERAAQIKAQNPDRKVYFIQEEGLDILKTAAETRRYRDIFVRNFRFKVEKEKTVQFVAMEFLLPDGTSYLSYQGTDGTIVGWKEDFLLAVGQVEAERNALEYLVSVASQSKRRLRLGGHSKGAHLAVYAAGASAGFIQDRIIDVYSNDGPGYSRGFLDSDGFKSVKSRIHRIVPEDSIVGMLLEHDCPLTIVKGKGKSIMQHDLLKWCVVGNALDITPKLTASSKRTDQVLKKWLSGFDDGQKIDFINDLFGVFETTGVDTFTELYADWAKHLPAMMKRINSMTPETKEMIFEVFKCMWGTK